MDEERQKESIYSVINLLKYIDDDNVEEREIVRV